MRTIFVLCGSILLAGGFLLWRTMQAPSVYGSFNGAQTVAASDLIERPKAFAGKTVSVVGIISQQCKAMGCFFFFRSGDKTLRIELSDIAMHAPMREGHEARVEGQIVSYGDGYQLFASAVEFK